MAGSSKSSHSERIVIILFLLLSGWWVFLQFTGQSGDLQNQLFGGTYGIIALFGAILGMKNAKEWGGFKSYVGRSMLMFAFGLLLQEFGQLTYWYYIFFKHIDVPYPSIGDIGYFGSIPFYVYGVILLGRSAGVKYTLQSLGAKILALLIPVGMLAFSYVIFLRGYTFDWSHPLTIFLDFGYPFGEAIYISLAIVAYLFSLKVLGGVMKYRVLIILLALFIQYLCDFTFLYQAQQQTWVAGGVNDFMYLISYFVMTVGLIQMDGKKIKKILES